MNDPIHIISLGAGVQSSTMALMAAAGEITPMPVAAIFADTQAEPKIVYTWLDWLEKKLPFPVHRVTQGDLRKKSLEVLTSKKSGKRYMRRYIPCFVKQPDGTIGLMGRSCTMSFKIDPFVRFSRTLCDWKRGETRHLVTAWIGISTDEVFRMKDSRNDFIHHRWPLIEKRVSRDGCKLWMKSRGFPEPPRSACTFCPFHSDEEWVSIKKSDEFESVVAYERELQAAALSQNALIGVPYLHDSCISIDQAPLYDGPSHKQLNMFNNECEGMCGV